MQAQLPILLAVYFLFVRSLSEKVSFYLKAAQAVLLRFNAFKRKKVAEGKE